MSYQSPLYNTNFLQQAIIAVLGWSWIEYMAAGLRLVHKLSRGLSDEGMYEVLDYETTLELKDKQGSKATFHKRQKVKYLQNNIIAYQDQAWGDGEILLDYSCSPGQEADRYRPGHKTYILISLREEKKKGDTDEFFIDWGIKDGFLREVEQWGTEISHRTKRLKTGVIFPKSRPPIQTWLVEQLTNKKHSLETNTTQLPDGRWLVQWESTKPRLHENYIIKWEW
jgi:hypothetical protein